MQTPTIHLNGTGAKSLAKEYADVSEALRALRDTLARATCHGRDFYPQGEDALPQALLERAEAFQHLERVDEYITAWREAIYDQSGEI